MSISRRRFLKVNGAVLTLPFLPSLVHGDDDTKDKGQPHKKLVIMYVPNGVVRRCFFPGEEMATLPGFIGGFNAKLKSRDFC